MVLLLVLFSHFDTFDTFLLLETFYSLSLTGTSFWALLPQWSLLSVLYYIGMAYTRILYIGMAEVSICILTLSSTQIYSLRDFNHPMF